MAIEFRCSVCNKLLRTADNAAGKHAKCPECGTVTVVPAASSGAPGGDIPAGQPPTTPPAPFPPRPSAEPENPYQSPQAVPGMSPFGAQPAGPVRPTIIDVGDIFRKTWAIFKLNWAMCLAVIVVVALINVAVQFFVGFMLGLVANGVKEEALTILITVLGQITLNLFSFWIGIGQAIFFLKTARGEDGSLGDIFSGGPYFVNVLLASLLFGLICLGGYLLCIVPGVIFALMFSQYYYLIIDRGAGITDSLTISRQVTTGNKLTLFAIGILALLLVIAAVIPCGLGLLVAVPYFTLMYPVVYLTITGQPTAAERLAATTGT